MPEWWSWASFFLGLAAALGIRFAIFLIVLVIED
jgi:hypothetical protein